MTIRGAWVPRRLREVYISDRSQVNTDIKSKKSLKAPKP